MKQVLSTHLNPPYSASNYNRKAKYFHRWSVSLPVSLQALVDRLWAVGRTPLDMATVPHMGGRPMERGGLLAVDGAVERVIGGWITRAASAPEITEG